LNSNYYTKKSNLGSKQQESAKSELDEEDGEPDDENFQNGMTTLYIVSDLIH